MPGIRRAPAPSLKTPEPAGVLTLALMEAAVAALFDPDAVPFDGDGTYDPR